MARVFRHICRAVTPEAGKMENGVQDAGCDDTGESHPAEEMRQTLQRENTDFFCSRV